MVCPSFFAALLVPAALASSPNAVVLIQHRAEMVTKTMRGIGLGKSASLSEKGYQLVAAEKSDEEMKAFIHRVVEKEARYVKDVSELSGFVPFYSGVQLVQNLETMKKELRNVPWVADGAGRNAALSEVGYQNVAKLRSKPHMVAFARRILDSDFKKVADEGALNGLVPYYDGELSVQSFEQLKNELLSAPWAVSRDSELENSLPNALPQVSLSESMPDKNDSKPVVSEATKSDEGCDDWCTSDLFVKVEANVTVLKNLSSWAMKCGWAHCGGCSACSDPSMLMAIHDQHKHDAAEHVQIGKMASCQYWCSGEVFQAVKQNVTSAKQFSWEMKCGWQNCGGCSKCAAQPDVVNQDDEEPVVKASASASAVKASEDLEEEEPVEEEHVEEPEQNVALREEVGETETKVVDADDVEPAEKNTKDESDNKEEPVKTDKKDKKAQEASPATHLNEETKHDEEKTEKDAHEKTGSKDEKTEHEDSTGSHTKRDTDDQDGNQHKRKEEKKEGKPAKGGKEKHDSSKTKDEPNEKGPLSWLFR